jgi:plastocyanin
MDIRRRAAPLALTVLWLLALLLPPAALQSGIARAAPAPVTLELIAIDDARIQAGSPDVSFPGGFLYFITLNGHLVFTKFDLSALPANATVDSAELRLDFTGALTGPNDIEVGRAGAPPWDESTLTWNNQPAITWGGPVRTVSANGVVAWDVTPLAQGWQSGAVPNNGFALRGNGGGEVVAHSKETCPPASAECAPPTLAITYHAPPPEGARPDLGDAPDSTNHVGIPNTAYPAVNGTFPTVWAGTPANAAAGPRHANQSGEGILGVNLSRENEADGGPDEDGVNNILNGGLDNADNERGDDGWRNRGASFDHCARTTLDIRVSRAPAATLEKMYLNVWFDGVHDGDWDDAQRCETDGGLLDIPAYEWIVQDYVVNMAAIPAGGFADLAVTTEVVLNLSPEKAHWMRFMLSEERAALPPSGPADGRGPNPNGALGSYRFGETEDVLQRPQPPGEPGTLELSKRVVTSSDPVAWGDMVTYEIRLRHSGGTQPLQAQLRDELPYPLHIHPIIVGGQPVWAQVASATGGAAPLQADVDFRPPQGGGPAQQIVTWQGALAPNAEISLRFNVHVLPLCAPGQQTETIRNLAQARARNGATISAEASFSAACPGYSASGIEIGGVVFDQIDPSTLDSVLMRGTITNKHSRRVSLGLTPLRDGEPVVAAPAFQQQIALEPGESKPWEFVLSPGGAAADDLAAGDAPDSGGLAFCILPGEADAQCPDAQVFPFLHGGNGPLEIPKRPRDLGDAPDSTNHANAPMRAYPGVQAGYPTVFDPATGLPEGPMHARPRPLHLGQQVSREAEADVGPDQDPLNNIVPPNDDPNNDRFDDGANPNLWNLGQCQTAILPVRVFISPQAAAWFAQQNKPAFLNIWLDANRDGDWADGVQCGANDAVEHIVIDAPVSVAALGAGLHTVNVPTGLVPWPAPQAQRPSWVRVTLSERESNKTLQLGAVKYGDGRGYPQPFQTGETEDYLMHPQGAPEGGPDLDVQLRGAVTARLRQPALAAAGAPEQSIFTISYANLGSRAAAGAVMTLTKPEGLRGAERTLLEAPGIPSGDIVDDGAEMRFKLPAMEPGQGSTITVGWATFPSGRASGLVATDTYSASVAVALAGDTDARNNAAAAAALGEPQSPVVAAIVGDGEAWGQAETTCRASVDIAGVGAPGGSVDLLIDGKPAGSALIDDEGIFYAQLPNLSDGRHEVRAAPSSAAVTSIKSPRDAASGQATGLRLDVDRGLPIDPRSLTFTDSQGRSFHPATLGWSLGASNPGAFLRAGETYQASVDSCVGDPNMRVSLSIIGVLIGLLLDHDGDGRYEGSFTYNPPAQLAASGDDELRLGVTTGGATLSYASLIAQAPAGSVRDALTGQPLADASVAALAPNGATWSAGALGQPNPQRTAADGTYRIGVPGDAGVLAVMRDGYQAYRSWEIAATSGALAQEIALMPTLAGAVAHTVYVSEQGFAPAALAAAPGDVVEVVNVGLGEHTATGQDADSGALAPGQRFRLRVGAAGSQRFADAASPGDTLTLVAEGGGRRIFLPLVAR